MTICIAGIAEFAPGRNPIIVLCADREVSGLVQFEGRESKIKEFTKACYVLMSCSDSFKADAILEAAKARVLSTTPTPRIGRIVEIISEECKRAKEQSAKHEVLDRYNLVLGTINAPPATLVERAMDELSNWYYNFTCEFIVAGSDSLPEPHIYTVDQHGESKLCDSLGFIATGSGSGLAMLELTRQAYGKADSLAVNMARIHAAKRVAERAEGVGRATDEVIMFYRQDATTGAWNADVGIALPELTADMDKALDEIHEAEAQRLTKLYEALFKKLYPQPPTEQPASETPK